MLQESAQSDNSEQVFRLRKEHKKKKQQAQLKEKLHERMHHHHGSVKSKPELNIQLQEQSDMKMEIGTAVQQKLGAEFVEVVSGNE